MKMKSKIVFFFVVFFLSTVEFVAAQNRSINKTYPDSSMKKVTYKVNSGDNYYIISRKFHINTKDLMIANNNEPLAYGKEIKIPEIPSQNDDNNTNTKLQQNSVSPPPKKSQADHSDDLKILKVEHDIANKKNYADIVKLLKFKYPAANNKKYLAPVEYEERVPMKRPVKKTVQGYSGNGAVMDFDVDDEETYYESVKRTGLKNISNKKIIIKGIERYRLSEDVWDYNDISIALDPGEVFTYHIAPFYSLLSNESDSSEIYFYDFK
ncbi:LysM repeat protein [Mucilaginibacter dorajii]|nr:LysM peptidoglycan-binding domain-containing protein [Mucilaginibacter dorajii]MCS3738002.1 LysM repeat protein [Mucilaginibacter dorajii]